MALSRLAAQFAAEINQHEWCDAHIRIDRAGHQRNRDPHVSKAGDPILSEDGTERVKMNVAWNVAQVLGYNDSNFNPHEFFEACGLTTWVRTRDGRPSGVVTAGLRTTTHNGEVAYQIPGTYRFDWE